MVLAHPSFLGGFTASPSHGIAPALPAPGGGMSIDRAPELLDAYGPDTVFLIGADLQRVGNPRRAAERLVAGVASWWRWP
jgi:ribulose-bisphosphate carboxylase large chain